MFDSHPLLHMSTSQMWCLKDIIYVLLLIISAEDLSSPWKEFPPILHSSMEVYFLCRFQKKL